MNVIDLLTPKLSAPGVGELSGEMLAQAKALAPGQVLQLIAKDGRKLALMDYDDFECILQRAGMGASTNGRDSNA